MAKTKNSAACEVVRIEKEPEAYKPFFNDAWASQMLELTKPTPKLQKLVSKLTFTWKIASQTASLPWYTLKSMNLVFNSQNNSTVHQERMAQLIDTLKNHLMPRLTLEPTQKVEVFTEMQKLAREIEKQKLPEPFIAPIEWCWDVLFSDINFRLSLWGSQHHCYSALFFAYEHFLIQCVRLANSRQKKYGRVEQLAEAYTEAFDQSFADEYVTDGDIERARRVRHAIAHNGSLETDQLRDYGHSFDKINQQIQIMPDHIRELYKLLMLKVTGLCGHLVVRPELGVNKKHNAKDPSNG